MIATQFVTQTEPQTTPINKTQQTHKNPSPVADGGGAERSKAEGVFVHAPNTAQAQPHNNPPPIPTLPKGKNLSRFLDAFLDGSYPIPYICDEFELTVFEVLALLESTEVQKTLEALKKIATIRQDTIATQARVTAIHRLSELATYAHTADAVEARAFEIARKSAAQIIRNTNPKQPGAAPRASRRCAERAHRRRPKAGVEVLDLLISPFKSAKPEQTLQESASYRSPDHCHRLGDWGDHQGRAGLRGAT